VVEQRNQVGYGALPKRDEASSDRRDVAARRNSSVRLVAIEPKPARELARESWKCLFSNSEQRENHHFVLGTGFSQCPNEPLDVFADVDDDTWE
jgi:hypothetical protein